MADINRQDIIRGIVAEVDGLSYSMAAASLEAILTCVTQALANHQSIVISDFGKFGVRHRRARLGNSSAIASTDHNPRSYCSLFHAQSPSKKASPEAQ